MPKSAHTFTKTILEMDLVGYSDLARMLEENLDVGAVKALEEQILQFIDYGLTEIGLQRNDIVIDTAGDNAILMFDDAATMHASACWQTCRIVTDAYSGPGAGNRSRT